MFISQISVFAENRPGALAQITGLLADAKIDMRAFSIADTADFGILRMIVDEPDRAAAVLREHNIANSINRVICVRMKDVPGAMHGIMKLLADAKIGVEYAYAFVSRVKGDAFVILRVDDRERAAAVFETAGLPMLSRDEVRAI